MSAMPPYMRSLVRATKRIRITNPPPPAPTQTRQARTRSRAPTSSSASASASTASSSSQGASLSSLRLPRAVQATYMAPFRRRARHEIKVCDLQLRSYSVRNLEVFADLAMRAAYYLRLPASGPRPLPRITERWTVPRSNFAHKKSQENFERITLRRHIQIKDGDLAVVGAWLRFLQKHRYYGVGMKANVFDHSGLDGVVADLEAEAERIAEKIGAGAGEVGGEEPSVLGDVVRDVGVRRKEHRWEEVLLEQPEKGKFGGLGPMGGGGSIWPVAERVDEFKMPSAPTGKAGKEDSPPQK